MNKLKFDKESLKAASDYSKRWSQDSSGLFLGGSEVCTSDMDDPSNEINNDPRFRIRVVM